MSRVSCQLLSAVEIRSAWQESFGGSLKTVVPNRQSAVVEGDGEGRAIGDAAGDEFAPNAGHRIPA